MNIAIFRCLLSFCIVFSCSCQKKEMCATKPIQSICINFIYNPLSLDPRKCTDPVTTVLNFMLYEGLTRLEPDGNISMALAERVQISKDRKTYIFHLKKCKWSDGTPITAHDFEASWKYILDPHVPSKAAFLLFSIKNAKKAKRGECALEQVGIRAIDDTQLYVELNHPVPHFLELTSFCVYFPTPCNEQNIPYPPTMNTKFSGPFMLQSWIDNDEVIVKKNPYYWNRQEVCLDEIHATIIKDEATALKLYEQGYLDWIGGLISPLPLDALPDLKTKSNLNQHPIAGTTFSSFNIHSYPFNNTNIRKAFSYAICRRSIVENISQMFEDIATGPVPHVFKGKNPASLFSDCAAEQAKFHLALGLQELGITKEEFPKIVYHYFTSELQRNLALHLQNVWKHVLGLKVELQCNELKTHLAKLHHRDFQIAQMSWIGQYYDRMSFLERFQTQDAFRNYSKWENSHYNQLIEQSFYKEGEERNHLLDQAEAIIANEMPIIPLYHYHLIYIKNPHLQNIMISPLGDIQFHKAFLTH